MLRSTTPVVSRPAPPRADRLSRCNGFRVDGVDGRIGTVTAIGCDAGGVPVWLEVRSGLFTHRSVTIGIRDVVSVDLIARRISIVTTARSGLAGGE